MAAFYMVLALIVQISLTLADDILPKHESREILMNNIGMDDKVIQDYGEAKKDWIDLFLGPDKTFYTSPSVAMIAETLNSEQPPEERLKCMKEMAETITLSIQNEMVNLLAYALGDDVKNVTETSTKTKRSVETPMDSTKLVTRLLKHIKSNNEYQNIAIEKMMTAQEIAQKYGIDFNPDDILTDLAVAGNQQVQELTTILKDAIKSTSNNVTQEKIDFIPLESNPKRVVESPTSNNTYYVYNMHQPETEMYQQNILPAFEYKPEQLNIVQSPINHVHYVEPQPTYNYYYPYETQIVAPPVQQHVYSPPVSQRPTFYESVYNPTQEYYPPQYCMEPVTTTTNIVLPHEDPLKSEPELLGEEFEETVSSKFLVDHEDPDITTVNHVMTYSVSEKSHFQNPHIESLPQQMQYYFFLV